MEKGLSQETVDAIKSRILGVRIEGDAPRDTRFKPGQSGNPKGRPPKLKPADDVLLEGSLGRLALEEAERAVRVREGEASREIPAKQAVLKAQVAAAVKGNVFAQEHLLRRQERFESVRQREIAAQNERYLDYQRECREQIEWAKRNGHQEPDLLPHPDDIVIVPGQPVKFAGPTTPVEQERLRKNLLYREALLVQAALDRRCHIPKHNEDVQQSPEGAFLFFEQHEKLIPPRLRLTEKEIGLRQHRLRRMTKRELLKEAYASWRKAGCRFKRGQLFPNFGEMLDLLKKARDAAEVVMEELAKS